MRWPRVEPVLRRGAGIARRARRAGYLGRGRRDFPTAPLLD
nr:MAG TPA: hypothetical protein [Bacteriophage sp.]